MPITNAVRRSLQDLIDFTVVQLAAAGDTTRSGALESLQALNDQRLDSHQVEVDALAAEVFALIEADPAAHDFWNQAQNEVWVALFALDPPIDYLAILDDARASRLGKTLPRLASLRRTLFLYSGG